MVFAGILCRLLYIMPLALLSEINYLTFNVMSKLILSSFSMQIPIRDCRLQRDADIKIRSSAYMMLLKSSMQISKSFEIGA